MGWSSSLERVIQYGRYQLNIPILFAVMFAPSTISSLQLLRLVSPSSPYNQYPWHLQRSSTTFNRCANCCTASRATITVVRYSNSCWVSLSPTACVFGSRKVAASPSTNTMMLAVSSLVDVQPPPNLAPIFRPSTGKHFSPSASTQTLTGNRSPHSFFFAKPKGQTPTRRRCHS